MDEGCQWGSGFAKKKLHVRRQKVSKERIGDKKATLIKRHPAVQIHYLSTFTSLNSFFYTQILPVS